MIVVVRLGIIRRRIKKGDKIYEKNEKAYDYAFVFISVSMMWLLAGVCGGASELNDSVFTSVVGAVVIIVAGATAISWVRCNEQATSFFGSVFYGSMVLLASLAYLPLVQSFFR